ncbi:MAG: 2-oxo-4-hydroxy-4-carboxy-5-ureidoimidazoline decarboxylase, partial [Planctomycetota bacterium]
AAEQAGVASATEETLHRLAAQNAEYERRFGRTFIVCATGKTAAEMLALLDSRLNNPPDVELQAAAAEQLKITKIRLQKLVS